MLVDTTLLPKYKIQDKTTEGTTLALIISEGESERQGDLVSVEREAQHARDLPSYLYREDRN
jgi:hypothetical protein